MVARDLGWLRDMDDVRVLRDAARRCYSWLREAVSVEEWRALLRGMVEYWDLADELERRRSSGLSPDRE
jgi:hypothetical protein